MAFKKYNENTNYRDVNTGEVFTGKKITDASYSFWKSNRKNDEWKSFRRSNSIEGYRNGYVGFINPNTKTLSTFERTGTTTDTMAQKSKTSINSNKSKTMKQLNIDMGPVAGNNFKLTVMGTVAVAVNGGFSSYDTKTGELTDVTGFTLDMDGMFYNMPSSNVEEGDLVKVKGGYGYVQEVKKNKVRVLLLDGEEKTLVSTKSPFGFNFYTKVVSIMDMGNGKGTGLFGDMNPMMLMMMSNKDGGTGNPFGGDMMSMMMMSQMMGGDGLTGLFGNGKKTKKSKSKKDSSKKESVKKED